MRAMIILVMAAGCGGQAGPDPILANAPRPDPATVAGAAAALAGAATLASPDSAAKQAEANKEQPVKKPVKVTEQVPASALDRLDEKGSGESKSFVEQAPSAPAPSTKSAPKKQ